MIKEKMKSKNFIDIVIEEIACLNKVILKIKDRQIKNSSTLQLIKTISQAWFDKYAPSFSQRGCSDLLSELNTFYKDLSTFSYSSTSKKKYLDLCKKIKKTLLVLQREMIDKPANICFSSDIDNLQNLVQDSVMQKIINDRYDEIKKCVNIAPLSATVMMGGVLEAIFLARINKEENKKNIFNQKSVPIDKQTNKAKNIQEWTLSNFIDVSYEMGWVRRAAKDVGINIMEYRNLIHPEKQLRLKIDFSFFVIFCLKYFLVVVLMSFIC